MQRDQREYQRLASKLGLPVEIELQRRQIFGRYSQLIAAIYRLNRKGKKTKLRLAQALQKTQRGVLGRFDEDEASLILEGRQSERKFEDRLLSAGHCSEVFGFD
jgi:hypothetical protein